MATDYCWIHGSSYIPREYQPHMKCIVDLVSVLDTYYQLVLRMVQRELPCFPNRGPGFESWLERLVLSSLAAYAKTKEALHLEP